MAGIVYKAIELTILLAVIIFGGLILAAMTGWQILCLHAVYGKDIERQLRHRVR